MARPRRSSPAKVLRAATASVAVLEITADRGLRDAAPHGRAPTSPFWHRSAPRTPRLALTSSSPAAPRGALRFLRDRSLVITNNTCVDLNCRRPSTARSPHERAA